MIFDLLTGIWLERALCCTIPCNDSTHFSSDSLVITGVFLVYAGYIYTMLYKWWWKGIQSVAGKQNMISSGKLNGLVWFVHEVARHIMYSILVSRKCKYLAILWSQLLLQFLKKIVILHSLLQDTLYLLYICTHIQNNNNNNNNNNNMLCYVTS